MRCMHCRAISMVAMPVLAHKRANMRQTRTAKWLAVRVPAQRLPASRRTIGRAIAHTVIPHPANPIPAPSCRIQANSVIRRAVILRFEVSSKLDSVRFVSY